MLGEALFSMGYSIQLKNYSVAEERNGSGKEQASKHESLHPVARCGFDPYFVNHEALKSIRAQVAQLNIASTMLKASSAFCCGQGRREVQFPRSRQSFVSSSSAVAVQEPLSVRHR